jgi:hypothetical protein
MGIKIITKSLTAATTKTGSSSQVPIILALITCAIITKLVKNYYTVIV